MSEHNSIVQTSDLGGGLVAMHTDAVTVIVEALRGVPRVLHWGARVDALGDEADYLRTLASAQRGADALRGSGPPAVLPEQSAGWVGTPGLEGHRDGQHFSTLFEAVDHTLSLSAESGARLTVVGRDSTAQLRLDTVLELTASGILRARATVTNESEAAPYTVDTVRVTLPVPVEADEILDFVGRHLRERTPQRHPFVVGTHNREGRRGRTGSDAATVLAAGSAGFDFGSGEVWAVHTAWSGNHVTFAERGLSNNSRVIGGGEVLLPGEVILAPGEHYDSPWVYAAYGRGLDEIAASFHRYLRSRASHPTSTRPVVLNTWEAVYFRHDLDELIELARVGAAVGVERFVLDDGWFTGRRDDTRGLGDWQIDTEVWPDGLGPLVSAVRSLGMQFGLWFEPEMLNADSTMAREHPDWILAPGDRLPISGRNQHVLNLTRPDAFASVLESMSAIIDEHSIDYIKWDHNRDLAEPGDQHTGRAAVHEQTVAVYALMDELKRRFPQVEIESCSSGGGRVDFEVLERTDRVWASDCIDPLERQLIQRWTGLLLPAELVGSHVGAPTAHTTRRTHSLAFRCATALFGHMGIEWDVRMASEEEREELAAWISLYKDVRHLVHTGTAVHADYPDAAYWAHGVVAPDQGEALFSFVAMETMVATQPGRIRLPGLDPDSTYRIEPVRLSEVALTRTADGPPSWWSTPTTVSGATLAAIGLQAPMLYPEQALVFRLVRVTAGTLT
ncbi:alpha-galactosidase [Microcella alkaliphila]